MFNSGDVILAQIQFTDTFDIKSRPSVVLFEEFGNVVVAGITSNTNMEGIKLSREDGAIKDSVIKTNYIFTISASMVKKRLFSLSKEKKQELFNNLTNKFSALTA